MARGVSYHTWWHSEKYGTTKNLVLSRNFNEREAQATEQVENIDSDLESDTLLSNLFIIFTIILW